jgi:phage baseplate assembly protein W|tara:strand:- start:137 stop:553 length:417 start_codon:yes stop_codon:yes gene_type:complete
MNNKEKPFLGRGWGFPPTFNKDLSSVEMVSNEKDIKESLNIYLSTKIGERIMRSDYGCLIHDYLFEPSDNNIISSIGYDIKRSIYKFEPRIHVIDVNTNGSDYNNGLIKINIHYEIISTNVRDNIVFPFYINEGTHIK